MGLKVNNASGGSVTLKEKSIETDDIIVDVRKLHSGSAWNSAVTYDDGDIVTVYTPLEYGSKISEQYISLVSSNLGNDPLLDPGDVNWRIYNTVKYIDEDVTVTVGAGALRDFPDLNVALNMMSKYTTVDNAEIFLELEAGHVIDYRVYVLNGQDCYIVVTSLDAVVTYDVTAISAAGIRYQFEIYTIGWVEFFHNIRIQGTFNPAASSPGLFSGQCGIEGWRDGGTKDIDIVTDSNGQSVSLFQNDAIYNMNIDSSTIPDTEQLKSLIKNCKWISTVNITSRCTGYVINGNVNSAWDGVTIRDAVSPVGVHFGQDSTLTLQSCDFRLDGVTSAATDLQAVDGGIIALYAGNTTGTNIPLATLTGNGIIW